MNSSTLLTLCLMAACTGAVIQQVRLYAGPNQTGKSVLLREKIPDISYRLKSFLNSTQSYCAVGWYDFYSQCDYKGTSMTLGGQGMDGATEKCGPTNLTGFTGAVRYTGPLDMATPALTLIQGSGTNKYGGREVVVYERARAWVPLNQTSVVYSHGGSNWTLFTGNEFGGSSWCYSQNVAGKMINHLELNATTHVRSVRRGCAGDADASGSGSSNCASSGHGHHH